MGVLVPKAALPSMGVLVLKAALPSMGVLVLASLEVLVFASQGYLPG
jgi:hypothetical protein